MSDRVRLKEAALLAAGPVNDSSFEELVLKAEVPVLVDFWAPWCGPCRMIAGTVDELAVEFEGKLKVVSVPDLLSLHEAGARPAVA